MNDEQIIDKVIESIRPVAWIDSRCLKKINDFDATVYARGGFDFAQPLYLHPAPAVVAQTLEKVALIAHHGGLAKMSESDALTVIRKLTIDHMDWNMTIGETKAALAAVNEDGL